MCRRKSASSSTGVFGWRRPARLQAVTGVLAPHLLDAPEDQPHESQETERHREVTGMRIERNPVRRRLRDREGQDWLRAARPHLFEFVAKYIELSLVTVGSRLTNAVLLSVAEGSEIATSVSSQARESQAR